MKKIIALTAFALFASAPAVQSAPAVTQELRATDFSSLKEVDPKPQDKSKTGQLRKGKGGPSSGAGEVMIKEVDPGPQGKLKGMKFKKSKGGPSSGAEEVGFKEVDPKPQPKSKGGPSSGADTVGFNPQPDPPGIDKKNTKPSTRMDTPRFGVPSMGGGAVGVRVR